VKLYTGVIISHNLVQPHTSRGRYSLQCLLRWIGVAGDNEWCCSPDIENAGVTRQLEIQIGQTCKLN